MPLPVKVNKELLFAAAPNQMIWALNAAYAEARKDTLVLERRDNDSHDRPVRHWQDWTAVSRRMRSPDNGRTWRQVGETLAVPALSSMETIRGSRQNIFDPHRNALLSIHVRSEAWCAPSGGQAWDHRRNRLFYEISRDGGMTWTPPRQIVSEGAGCDDVRWMPGIYAGRQNVCVDQGPFVLNDNREIVFGMHINEAGSKPENKTAFLIGRWDAAGAALQWEMSQKIEAPPGITSSGVCEPDLTGLPGGRLLTTMRCQGIRDRQVPSSRQFSVSDDGGRTWTAPQTLCYEDGKPVWVPASIARFMTDPRTGRIFWFANILDHPVYGQIPRYPLALAELDPERLCLIRDTVSAIQDLPPGAPAAGDGSYELGRRYSNFGYYVDRASGEFAIMAAEEPKTTWEHPEADCYRWRVQLD